MVADESSDYWREGCWEFLTVPLGIRDHQATAVLAFSLDPRNPEERLVVVNETTDDILFNASTHRWANQPLFNE